MVTTGNPGNNRCQALTRKGEPCRGYRIQDSRYCFWHAPSQRRRRKEARSAGGLARHGRSVLANGDPVDIGGLGDLVGLVNRAINDTLTLENSVARNRTLGYLAGVAIAAIKEADIEQRLARLEELLEQRNTAA